MRRVSSGRPSRSSSGSMPPAYRPLFGPDAGELDERRRGQAHVLDADPLPLAVRVVAAREDVRGREAHLGERGAVGAASDRRLPRFEPDAADRLFEVLDDLGVPLDAGAGIPVLDPVLDGDRAAGLVGADLLREPAQERNVLGEARVLEVSRDEADLHFRRVARHEDGVDVALAILRRLRGEPVLRQPADDLGRDLDRVDELLPRPAGMDRPASDPHPYLRAREGLRLQLAGRRAVDGVRGHRAEAFDGQVDHAAADLLVRVEHDLDRSMRDFRMRGEVGDCGEDLGHAGFVVGAEQGHAVGRDELVADVALELRRLLRTDRRAGVAEPDLAPFVVEPVRARRSTHLARSVDVREESDRRDVMLGRRRKRRRHVAVLVERGIGEPGLLELVAEKAEEDELSLGARVRLGVLVRLGVDLDVADEPLGRVLGKVRDKRRRFGVTGHSTSLPRLVGRTGRLPGRSVGAVRLRLVQLYAGLLLYGVSSSLLVLSGLGLDPWDVFHQGLARQTGLAIGTWAILVGVAVLGLWIPLRQRPGIGTLSNVVLVGGTMDVVLGHVHPPHALSIRILCLVTGVFLNGVATGAYIGAGLGPGPRDGLAPRRHGRRGDASLRALDRPARARLHPALLARSSASRGRARSRMTAVGLSLLSALFFGAMSVTLRMGLQREPDIGLAASATVVPAIAVAVIAAAAEAPSRGFHLAGTWPFLLAGLLSPGAAQILATVAIREAGASRVSMVFGAAPLFSVTTALIFLGEPVRLPLVAGAVLVVAGGVELARERERPGHLHRIGLLYAVAGAMLFAIRDNLVRHLAVGGTSVPPAVAAAAALVGGGTLVLLWARRGLARRWLAFLPAGLFFGGSYVALFEAYYRGRVTVVAPLVAIESLAGVALSILLLRDSELVGKRLVLGAGLIVAGGALIGAFR